MVSRELETQILAISTFLVFIKVFFTFLAQGKKKNRPPEDVKIGVVNEAQENSDEKSLNNGDSIDINKLFDERQRWTRIGMNDIENIPIGLMLMWASWISNGNRIVNITFSLIFSICRIIHTICYAKGIALRPLFWFLAYTSQWAFAINICIGAWK